MLRNKLSKVGVSVSLVALATLGIMPQTFAGTVLSPDQAFKTSNSYLKTIKVNAKLHALLPAAIKSKGFILIGAQLMNAPDDFFAGTSQTPVGFEVNLAQAFGKILGVKIKYLQLPDWNSIVPSVQDGRVDMSMTAMNDRVAREQLVDFIDYLVDGVGIMAKAGNPLNITGPSSLCGKNVTDSAGTTQQIYLQSLNATGGLCASNQITEINAPDLAQEMANLATGRADAILGDNITDAYTQQTNPSAVFAVPYPAIMSGPYGMGFAKDNRHLRTAVLGAMQILMKGGSKSTYMKILTAWNVASVAIPAPVLNGCSTPQYGKGC